MGSGFFSAPSLPDTFKGLALFTPGGDLVYCIDPDKKSRWHLQLCALLQEIMGLAEPPHFLVPCFTATLDRWRDPKDQQLYLHAEAHPLVMRYQVLLNAVFSTDTLVWQPAPVLEGVCDRLILDRYQPQFPQLWENHDLIVRFTGAEPGEPEDRPLEPAPGYVLRLYVSGHTHATETILKNLHELLERSLNRPYTLRVVDIHKNPEQAEQDKVTATPTLVRVYPRPIRRLVGDFKDANQLLQVFTSLEL
ncbi:MULTISPECIES: circadian clock KaiB family protein [unclassified Leptolyngbya]|uniref:circadian clock KaiB family protein n=1 Tax=unclassified Leptolyngbya TaxID=2650499 RepID=UPI001688A202|nr:MULTISPECIES: circadian clock KaiB family protein [unclassified Leptolyngbya]MBD1913734.1 circadian clock protein KaiB [Leptolyngbya sp. FACHB-8]MBD2153231.1 circadian clock protein KaiB [Leptolyngbya sp. FACHB-16]